ncbi:MAG: hypothetical protein FXF47_08895 [Candidatus Mcinerneyibacterium aminivorans]|uniref:Peptidase MA-like domain-containing protein n=1 Tax=Candidatus Mcinerneyibacterium aminivorans TaxID=2703815 RepID=A0A5D0MFX7_9BACT|nr:MAG: hypothetical protein FXF47_08895 [Candidatus Mcinerneyibacterium aminivorans]
MEINYSDKITIYIYENIEQTGWDRVGGRAYPKTNTVETIYNEEKKSIGIRGASAHEIVHVIISNLFGSCKFQLLAEGIAVAMDGLWNHPTLGLKEVDEITLYYDELDKIPSLDKINDYFDEFESSFSYPLSGSFILFLLEKYGPEKFKKLYSQDADKDLEDSINLAYSTTLDRLKNEWINHCRNNL